MRIVYLIAPNCISTHLYYEYSLLAALFSGLAFWGFGCSFLGFGCGFFGLLLFLILRIRLDHAENLQPKPHGMGLQVPYSVYEEAP